MNGTVLTRAPVASKIAFEIADGTTAAAGSPAATSLARRREIRCQDRASGVDNPGPTPAGAPVTRELGRERALGGPPAGDLASQKQGREEPNRAELIRSTLRHRYHGTPLYSFCSGRLARYRAEPPQSSVGARRGEPQHMTFSDFLTREMGKGA